jgi:hypothetical protein
LPANPAAVATTIANTLRIAKPPPVWAFSEPTPARRGEATAHRVKRRQRAVQA